MKIGFCYDTKLDYGFQEDSMEYTDFVSLHTVTEIKRALEKCGHTVEYIGNVDKLRTFLEEKRYKDVDLIFNIAEGFGSRNREALIPSLLEIYQVPYTASDTYGMAINLNKHHTKILAAAMGIPVPLGLCYKKLDSDTIKKISEIGYPIVLKLNSEGGSMGVTLVQDEVELIRQTESLISQYHSEIIAEKYIIGKEITVPIIGNGDEAKALGVVLILHKDGSDVSLYDRDLKGADNDITNSLQTGLEQDIEKSICEYSLLLHRSLDLRDYSRMDFRVTPQGEIYFLEVNTMPSLGRDGSFELCGKSLGLEYHEVIGKIIEAASKRYNFS